VRSRSRAVLKIAARSVVPSKENTTFSRSVSENRKSKLSISAHFLFAPVVSFVFMNGLKHHGSSITMLGLIFILCLFSGCQECKQKDDPEKLKEVLLGYFEGIENKDFRQMTSATTDDFVLYEMGRVWNNDSVFKEMKKFPYSVNYSFEDFKINVDANSGHATYFNHGDFLFNDARQSFDWIESAAFRKTEEGWKMYFLHISERYDPLKTSQK
jgi:hypothetical protein